MDVWIQKIKGEFHNANTYTAWRGFEQLGAHIEFFDMSQIHSLPLQRETPVIGGIPCVLKALEILGQSRPQIASLPAQLHAFYGRKIEVQTLQEVRNRINEETAQALFIKPLPHDHKLFDGHVVSRFRDLIQTAGIDPQTPILTSEVVDFIAEYRGFVHQNELVGFRHYRGDFRFYPDMKIVDAGLRAFVDSPVACSMDWGVTRDGRTLLIEINDAYSLGCYGLDPLFYAPMLRDRWFQMVNLT